MKDVPVSPNSFHYEKDPDTGNMVLKPGLGADEPSEIAKKAAAEAAAAYRKTEEALVRAQEAVEAGLLEVQRRSDEQARLAEEQAAEFDRKMKELEDREAALAAREAGGSK